MPRGKYTRKNKRNENGLTTRLMQISLAMDDHIYCGKLITTSQAGGYLQEIATLKLRCLPTNVRALQVIEKLTRCMRSILVEDTGDSFHKSLQMSEFGGPASPVYSLPDEDRTYATTEQDGVENADNFFNSGDDESPLMQNSGTHLSLDCANMAKVSDNSHNLLNPKHTLDEIEIIDITNASDDDVPEYIHIDTVKGQNIAIENVNTKMLNMAIEETSMQGPVEDHDCSQSILDDFDNQYSTNLARKNGTVFEKASYNTDAKVHIANKVNNYFAQHTSTNNTHQKILDSQPTEVDLNVSNESVKQTQPSTLKNKNKRVRRKNVANRKDETVKTKRNSKSVDKNGQNYKQNVCKTMVMPNATCNEKESVPKTVKKFKNRPNKSKTCAIYNKNVENDLSWVENIRYVREISSEEHDPALLLPDNFWDNFALPDKWNDLDFEY